MPGDPRIAILGPLEVRAGSGLPVEVAGARLRRLLLRLALDPGRVVTSAQLVDAVWDDHPPAGAANALQTLVSRLRRLLPGVLESSPSGYRLAVDAEAVDAVRFEALALAGRRQLGGDPDRARDLLGEALALWRGPALADAATAAFAGPAVARLDGLRPQALEDRVEADLAAGATDRLVAELEELVAGHPLSERLGGQLVRALALRGAQADALGAYARLRARLADELGIDPSPELQAVHVACFAASWPPGAGHQPRRAAGRPRCRPTRGPHQPPLADHQLRRPRRRPHPDHGGVRRGPPGDPDRTGRGGQDPAGRGGRGHDAPLVGTSGASCAGALTRRSHPADTPHDRPAAWLTSRPIRVEVAKSLLTRFLVTAQAVPVAVSPQAKLPPTPP